MTKNSGQNQFHGSTGGSRTAPKGGTQHVIARHVIGAYECWCQGALCWVDLKTGDQTWPGKEKGAAHPSSATIERIRDMVTTVDRLDRSDVQQYPKRVQELLLTLVNECHIRCRPITGTEMLLYPPDGESRPFKVMARRSEKASLGFIEKQFIAAYDVRLPAKKEPDVGEPTQTFTAKKKAAAVPAPQFTAKRAAPKPQEWAQAMDAKGNVPLENWETDGQVFRCLQCKADGLETIFESSRSLGGHTRAAHGDGGMWTEEARAKNVETRRANRMRRQVEDAIGLLQTALGVEVKSEETEALTAQVASLKAELASTRAALDTERNRADEAESRVALMREALSV